MIWSVKPCHYWIVMCGLCLAQCGCAGAGFSPSTRELSIYGNFCGPNHPLINAPTQAERLIALEAVVPADDLDLMCKKHDICYESEGFSESDCDAKLLAATKTAAFERHECKMIADLFVQTLSSGLYHRLKGIDDASAGVIAGNIITTPYRVSHASLAVVNGAFSGFFLGRIPSGSCNVTNRAQMTAFYDPPPKKDPLPEVDYGIKPQWAKTP